jgi:hypothetical protein
VPFRSTFTPGSLALSSDEVTVPCTIRSAGFSPTSALLAAMLNERATMKNSRSLIFFCKDPLIIRLILGKTIDCKRAMEQVNDGH